MKDNTNHNEEYLMRRQQEFLQSHDKEQAWQNIQRRIADRSPVVRTKTKALRWAGIAAMVAILAGAGLWLADSDNPASITHQQSSTLMSRVGSRHAADIKMQGKERTVSVPHGAGYAQQMTDGTNVQLNAGAVISYAPGFDGNRREVSLKGEAYFEVAHNASKPFVVNTPSGSIEVLGTHFNVISETDHTIVTLSEGSVRLHYADNEYVMTPGEQARIYNDGSIDVQRVNTTNYTSWSTGTYEFTDVPLQDIVRQLSLWYDVTISIDSRTLAKSRYTGAIMRSETLHDALHTLTTISDIKLRLTDNTIHLYE